jgi:hypothetical protein
MHRSEVSDEDADSGEKADPNESPHPPPPAVVLPVESDLGPWAVDRGLLDLGPCRWLYPCCHCCSCSSFSRSLSLTLSHYLSLSLSFSLFLSSSLPPSSPLPPSLFLHLLLAWAENGCDVLLPVPCAVTWSLCWHTACAEATIGRHRR